ncbi:putative exosome complex component RRP45 [Plasmodium gaboni]|uniref:Putative exosome complex component RRP45 n=1 Tax=Plasmodium gaboni TaxID=647221 RepID=A0A151LEL1_9APIC|nr:putative exosome complex component RRP45 [Plasmodium gaboni]KYN97402.1 putative exosome complex component RRP45 [Plasmodium gaboni]
MIICNNNVNHFWKNIKKNIRLDGRTFEDSRNVCINFLKDYGHVEITIGYTKVICKITSEIVKPHDRKLKEGMLKINLDIDNSIDENENNDNMSDECLEIKNIIDRVLKTSNIINFESLCIIPGKKVWCIYINIMVIENDGNLTDACYLSAYCGLVHFKNHQVKVIKNGNIIIDKEDINYSPLSILNSPIVTTFAFYEEEDVCLIDPCLYEEEFMSSKISIALNKNGNLISLLKPGGIPLACSHIMESIEIAKKRILTILKILEDTLEEDKNIRNYLNKRNLHVKYSSLPVTIKYDNSFKLKPDISLERYTKNSQIFEDTIKKIEEYIKYNQVQECLNNMNVKLQENNEDAIDIYTLNREGNLNEYHNFNEQDNKRYTNENININKHNINNQNSIDPMKNTNLLNPKDIAIIKRQEFLDNHYDANNNNNNNNNKYNKQANKTFKKELIDFSNSFTKGHNKSNNFSDNQNDICEQHDNSQESSDDVSTIRSDESSDIDFSVAINQNLKKKK